MGDTIKVRVPGRWIQALENPKDAGSIGMAINRLNEATASIQLMVRGEGVPILVECVGRDFPGVDFKRIPQGYLPVHLFVVVDETNVRSLMEFPWAVEDSELKRLAREAVIAFVKLFHTEYNKLQV